MDIALRSELLKKAPLLCTLVKIELPEGPVCLTDGGFAEYAGEIYYGQHGVYGVLSEISSIKDGLGSDTPRVEITIQPPSDAAVATLASPLAQGSRVQWWEGAIDEETGLLVGQPLLKFIGEIDKPVFSVKNTEWSVTIECGTEAERQLEPNAERRLNHQFHQLCWPGEMGMVYLTGVLDKQYWRMDNPNGAIKFK